MNITEKAAYLKGLMAGMEIKDDSKEGKLFKAIADLLEDICLTVADLEDGQAYLEEYIDEIDMDLGEVERDIYECDDECDCGCGCGPDCDCGCQDGYECTCGCDDDDYCDGDCCNCDEDCCDCFATICPTCGEEICYDVDLAADSIICPACNTEIELEDIEEIDE